MQEGEQNADDECGYNCNRNFPRSGLHAAGPFSKAFWRSVESIIGYAVQTYCDFYQTRKGMSNFHTTVLDRHPTHAKMGWHGIMF
jgi:hypothetical protein